MNKVLVLDPKDQFHPSLVQEFLSDDTVSAFHLATSSNECLIKATEQEYQFAVLHLSQLENQEREWLVRELSTASPTTEILVLGELFPTEDLLTLIEAGADAYIRDRGTAGEIRRAIHQLQDGVFTLCPDITAAMMDRIAHLAGYRLPIASSEESQLTPRQQEVLYLLREGLTNAEIAEDLYIEVGTVKNHVHNLLQKLDAEDRYEAAELAHSVIADYA